MTESLGEVRAALALVAESLGIAHQHARLARDRLEEAVALLTGLDGHHSESLVPPELLRATEELDRGLGVIGGGRTAVADIDARM